MMIEVREGFDPAACAVMYHAFADGPGEDRSESEQSFVDRAEHFSGFLGFYDPEPAGGFIYDGPKVHIALDKRIRGHARDAIAHCVHWGLARWPILIARIHPDNDVTQKLTVAMRFKKTGTDDKGWYIYERISPWT